MAPKKNAAEVLETPSTDSFLATVEARIVDIDRQFQDFQNHTQVQWDMLSPGSRYGFSYDDFQRVKGKYGIVAAVPITDRNDKYIGCVSLDMPPKRTAKKTEVIKSLTATASVAKLMV